MTQIRLAEQVVEVLVSRTPSPAAAQVPTQPLIAHTPQSPVAQVFAEVLIARNPQSQEVSAPARGGTDADEGVLKIGDGVAGREGN